MKDWRKVHQANTKENKADASKLISDKLDFIKQGALLKIKETSIRF